MTPSIAVSVLAMPMNVQEPSNANWKITNATATGTNHTCGVSSWLTSTSWFRTTWINRAPAGAGAAEGAASARAAPGAPVVRPESASSRSRSATASATVRNARGASVFVPPITSSRSSARPARRARTGRTTSTACSRSSGIARVRR
jgi:hypothetical protein